MQEDKEQVFDAADNLMLALAAMEGMVKDMTANRDALAASAGSGFSTATDLADWLVRALNMPFRDAHHVTGSLVAMAEKAGCDLAELSLNKCKLCMPILMKMCITSFRLRPRSHRACPMVAQHPHRYWYKSNVGVISYEAVFDVPFACDFGFFLRYGRRAISFRCGNKRIIQSRRKIGFQNNRIIK